MADDEMQLFDPTMKKKKKKKTMYNPDAPDGGDAATNAPPSSVEEAPAEEKAASGDEGGYDAGVTEDISLDFSGRKKKKKKAKVVDTMDMKEVKEALPEGSEEKEEEDENKEPSTENIEELLLLKKKPRKAKVAIDKDLDKDGDNDDTDGSAVKAVGEKSWTGSDRDYIYDELLTRVFDIMREKNPEMIAGEKKKIVMRPPQVLKAGARRTSFANFADISRMLHRQPKHVLAFLLAELGTSGSVDGNNQLIIRGKFNQKQIENVLRRYIKEYVMCHTCKSSDTLMQKEERLFFLQCETCGSRCSVASIKSGFQAVTGRRAAMRAK